MANHPEPLNGGLWTAEDPGLLQPGQLPVIYNGVYKAGSQALWRAIGRSGFGTASSVAVDVDGLRDAKFDNATHILIAHASASYLSAAVGDTGTFGVLVTGVGDGEQLEVVHYRNRFFLFNGVAPAATATGVNNNRVIYLSATGAGAPTLRPHGMVPVSAQPYTTATAQPFSQTVTGYYEYWTTEVAKFTQDGADVEMEGTFIGKPATVWVSSTGMSPVIQRPDIVNGAIATHWRIYRSTKKDLEKDVRFPIGFLIADVSTGASSVIDTQTTASASSFPSAVNSGTNVYAEWADAANLTSDNTQNASASVGAFVFKRQGAYAFNLGGFTGQVKGVKIEIEASVDSGQHPLGVTLVRNRQSDGGIIPTDYTGPGKAAVGEVYRKFNSASKSVTITGASMGVYSVGGATDGWWPSNYPPLRDSDFGPNFMVILNAGSVSGTRTFSVDYVKATVYYGATIDTVIPFPTVVYTFGDITAQVGKNGPPPTSSTGDLFEDTLVVNDVNSPSVVRYSYPGDPESFPGTYFLDFETRENDQVRCIKVVNNRCMVWLDSSLFRLNYLPSERDASFDRGKAIETVSSQYGAVNPMCVAIYSPDGATQKAAFVSHKGIFATDGYRLEELTAGLDWRGVISTTSTSSPICLINDPEQQELVFYYRNDGLGNNETYMALHLSYAADHIEGERLKVSGPVVMRNYDSGGGGTYASLESAWAVPRSSGTTSVYLGYGGSSTAAGAGRVYRENGSALPIETPTLRYATREMYLAGFGKEWRSNDLRLYVGGNQAAVTASAQAKTRKANDDTGLVAGATNSLTFNGRRLGHMPLRQMGEAIQLTVTASGADQAHHFMLIDGSDFGLSDPGK